MKFLKRFSRFGRYGYPVRRFVACNLGGRNREEFKGSMIALKEAESRKLTGGSGTET